MEMALILPLLCLLILGIIEIGRYAEFSITVANAARAGVQYGSQNLATASDTTGIQNAATRDAVMTPPLVVTPTLLCYCSGQLQSCDTVCATPNIEVIYLKVTTTGTYTPLFKYPGVPIFTSANGMAQMLVEQ
jgi:Flp pilus assembly protein TadG